MQVIMLIHQTVALLIISISIAQAALTVREFSPQGEVRNVTQITAVFSSEMIKLGDTNATAPFNIDCPITGTAHWTDTKIWQYQLSRKLQSGERCTFSAKPLLKSLQGEALIANNFAVNNTFTFYVVGPWLANIQPTEESSIEEDQHFIIETPFSIKPQSVEAHAWCETEGVGEHIPVKVLSETDVQKIIASFDSKPSEHAIGLRCSRPLPAGANVKLVWGRGVESVTGGKTRQNEEKHFKVRPTFRAELACTREKPTTPCSPLSDLTLQFSDQVSIEMAQKIQLIGQDGIRNPRETSPARKKELVAKNAKAFYLNHVLAERDHVDAIVFKGPFKPNANFSIALPADFKDASGRMLANIENFPLKTQIGMLPPLAKFAADFGVLEKQMGGILPVTLRNVESDIQMRVVKKNDAKGMFALTKALSIFESQTKTITSNKSHFTQRDESGEEYQDSEDRVDYLYPRELSFLDSIPDANPSVALPKLKGEKAFEVIGIPLTKPGFYVVEIASKVLGNALLSEGKPMYVRSQALVTDLSVHLKKGRDNSAIWVTSLATGKPVNGATVELHDCNGGQIWKSTTNAEGLALYEDKLPEINHCEHQYAYFATAKLGEDFSFVRSDWNRGIEAWRFNVNTWAPQEDIKTHTILDRTMLRAGETISMKHITRQLDYKGYQYTEKLPQTVKLELIGGDFSIDLPLTWDNRGVATNQWQIPKEAKIGTYGIKMQGAYDYTAQFRVSEFRLPAYKGTVQSAKNRYAHINTLPINLGLAYLNGGAANGQLVQVSSMMNSSAYNFPNYAEFNFSSNSSSNLKRLVLDKKTVKLDAQGTAQVNIPLNINSIKAPLLEPVSLQTEMTFTDPNGEIQTISGNTEVWPAKLAIGLQMKDWAGLRGQHKLQAVALDVNGKPVAGVKLNIFGKRKWDYVHRKRIIGGFYSYETEKNQQDLGQLCTGTTDKFGFYQCQINVKEAGEIELQAKTVDADGAPTQTNTGFWVSNDADFWFDQADEDRMEVIAEKREYQAGETARFQVHSPFYQATVLIAVEREGILKTIVQPLYRRNSVVEIPIERGWGPNVFVSVLAVRGRITDVPWGSFFQWGWHSPVDWVKAKWDAVPQATALVDLAKPAYKFGLTKISVGTQDSRLNITLQANKISYQPREMATIKVKVLLPNGKPAPASSEIAIAAVDRALLELAPNSTWDLPARMQQEHAYLMDTATAQMQVVGKRHFGKKALAAGGGGGKLSTRELFNTLLYWNPRVKLDQHGLATVKFPLNDSLTSFKIVAIADINANLFGTGETEIASRQDLQLTSGIPPLVREGDAYRAMLVVRNSTQTPMQIKLTGRAGTQSLSTQTLKLAAGESKDAAWQLRAPENMNAVSWQIEATDSNKQAQDRLRFTQQVLPRVPVTVQQASLMQLESTYHANTALPNGALLGKGGLEVQLTASLAKQNAGIVRYFNDYPYSCLEQKVSIATGLNDKQRWADIVNNLASYQDTQGYLSYFPGMPHGSDALTAYALTMAYENHIKLPEQVEQNARKALFDFIEGRTKPYTWHWGNQEYLKERRLTALSAVSYTGTVTSNMLSAFEFKPIQMPTASLIDWYVILKNVPKAENRQARLNEVSQELRNRLQNVSGRLMFDQEENDTWWWAMVDAEYNATRLTSMLMDDPEWKSDMAGLMRGAMMRQEKGRWHTTLSNAWGRLALDHFGQQFELETVTGQTKMTLNSIEKIHQWQDENITANAENPTTVANTPEARVFFAWPKDAPNSSLSIEHHGTGKPWVNLLVNAAIPAKTIKNGYTIQRTVTAVERKVAGQWRRGDIMRVRIDVDAMQSLNWIALSDPIPAGASILGNTARDSVIAQAGENQNSTDNDINPSYTERGLGFFRAYYEYVPKGHFWVEYTLRLNNPGQFNLPATRVEAMYAPEVSSQLPNQLVEVK